MRANLLDYLQAHVVDHDIFYVGKPGISVSHVHDEAGLRASIEDFLDREAAKNGDWSGQSAGDVRGAIQRFVRAAPDLAWARELPVPPVKPFAWYEWVGVVVAALLISPAILLWLLLVRVQEVREDKGRGRQVATTGSSRASPSAQMLAVNEDRDGIDRNIREVTTIEDEIVQNQLSHVVDIKPGWFRLATLKIVLKILNFSGRRIYNQEALLGVRTLHFVRWMIIDEGKTSAFSDELRREHGQLRWRLRQQVVANTLGADGDMEQHCRVSRYALAYTGRRTGHQPFHGLSAQSSGADPSLV